MIACLRIPHFAAAVECRAQPDLAGVPLIISTAPNRVFAVCAQAARCGVSPGMPVRQALALCPTARSVPAHPTAYQQVLNDLLTLLTPFSQRIEPEQPGQLAALIYLDLSHLSRVEQRVVARQIGQTVKRHMGLSPALGLAGTKFCAQIAAFEVTPNKILVISPGREAAFLAPRSINHLPLDPELARRFHLLGLSTLGHLARLPAGAVLAQFGPSGYWFHQLARGHDERPVLLYPPPPVEQITCQFDGPVEDWNLLAVFSRTMAEELATRLQRSGRAGRLLQLTLHLENGMAWEGQRRLSQPTSRPERLAHALTTLIHRSRVTSGVTALTVGLAELSPIRPQQLDLFAYPNQAAQEQRLHDLLPHLVARYGSGYFYQAAVTHRQAGLPERRFLLQEVARR